MTLRADGQTAANISANGASANASGDSTLGQLGAAGVNVAAGGSSLIGTSLASVGQLVGGNSVAVWIVLGVLAVMLTKSKIRIGR